MKKHPPVLIILTIAALLFLVAGVLPSGVLPLYGLSHFAE